MLVPSQVRYHHAAPYRRTLPDCAEPAFEMGPGAQQIAQHVRERGHACGDPWIVDDIGDRIIVARQVRGLGQALIDDVEQAVELIGDALRAGRQLVLPLPQEIHEMLGHRPEAAVMPVAPLSKIDRSPASPSTMAGTLLLGESARNSACNCCFAPRSTRCTQ